MRKGRKNLFEELGRVEGEHSNKNRRDEVARIHGELNKGYKGGKRVRKSAGGKVANKVWGVATHGFNKDILK